MAFSPGEGLGMEETHSQSKECENRARWHQQVNWWGIFGLLCGIGSAYLSLRILFEAVSLLGTGL